MNYAINKIKIKMKRIIRMRHHNCHAVFLHKKIK